jgi:hypothetical protein
VQTSKHKISATGFHPTIDAFSHLNPSAQAKQHFILTHAANLLLHHSFKTELPQQRKRAPATLATMAAWHESTVTVGFRDNSPDDQQINKGHGWPSMLIYERPMHHAMVLEGAVMPFLLHDVMSIEEVDDHGLLNASFETESSPIRLSSRKVIIVISLCIFELK